MSLDNLFTERADFEQLERGHVAAWPDDKLTGTYQRLSGDLEHLDDIDTEHIHRMCVIEEELRTRGIDPAGLI